MTDAHDGSDRPTNRLAGETSPYLLQHSHNPVDWYPWGPEALESARALDQPIFLSIGYAACHWCHVMERESFEDEATAADLRRDFVAIKVDREERPDLDAVYMAAVQAMTGGGGWPMSVFLTPDGHPFYGGTYFPPEPRHGLPGFRQVLAGVAAAWRDRRAELEASGQRLVQAIVESRMPVAADPGLGPDRQVLEAAVATLQGSFDARRGGWGGAPRFPPSMTIAFLLRRSAGPDGRPGSDPDAMAMARRTLDAMAAGGIHDQLGGGFHRYATDAGWLVPHFEQMLYDNALLADAYLDAWRLTGEPAYRGVAFGVLDFIARDLRRSDGTFAASLDADTLGVEGATFTWAAAEIGAALGDEAALFAAAYGVTEGGNWEGRTILSRVRDDAELAERFGRPEAEVAERLAAARAELFVQRSRRPQPARDDKALTAWNGLAIGAFARAAAAVDAPERATRYRDLATTAATALLAGVRDSDGRIRRSWKDGRATADGVLEDHADLAAGLLALYEATFDERWFVAARDLADAILDRFADPEGGFFDTAADAEALIARPKELQDNAVPSGGAMSTTVLLRLAALTGEGRYRDAADAALRGVVPVAPRHPSFFGQWLVAIDLSLAAVAEVAIVGSPVAPETVALVDVARRGLRPHLVLAVGLDPPSSAVPLLQGRFALHDRATAFVCRDFACRQPVHEPAALAALLLE
ncbi:MAG: thioredoxin domain-containing protein [Chloroflexi bacterium]|nr:thioredoxin domain-containing protein [Chloroflexota bacterium]